MRTLPAPLSWRWTLPLPVLLSLLACASAPPEPVYRDRPVPVPVPVVQQIDERLTRECVPRTSVPFDGALTFADLLDRLAATEDALAICNNDKAELREAGR